MALKSSIYSYYTDSMPWSLDENEQPIEGQLTVGLIQLTHPDHPIPPDGEIHTQPRHVFHVVMNMTKDGVPPGYVSRVIDGTEIEWVPQVLRALTLEEVPYIFELTYEDEEDNEPVIRRVKEVMLPAGKQPIDTGLIPHLWAGENPSVDQIPDYSIAALTSTMFPSWAPDMALDRGDMITYDGQLYETIQPHTTQSDWTPPNTPALFVRRTPDGQTGEWTQPLGGHDAYQTGAIVTYQGQTWESEVDNNVWAPGVYGWTLVGEGGGEYLVWVQPTGAHDAYNTGDRVHYPTIEDPVYESLIDGNVWSPSANPSGWQQID